MAGVPAHTQELLRASANIDRNQTESILSRARAVVNNERIAATVDRSATEKVPLPKPTENSLYYFNCSGPNHLAKHCQFGRPMLQMPGVPRRVKMSGKQRQGRDVSATLALGKMKTSLSVMRVCINGVMRDALIGSGCTRSLVRSSVCCPLSEHKTVVLTVDGKNMTSKGVTSVNLRVDKRTPVVVDMLAMDGDLLGFDLMLVLDVIRLLGGVHINEHGEANFPNEVFSVDAADAVKIE